MRWRWLLCGAAALPVMAASGQQKAVEQVNVVGQRPAVQSLADRQIYTIDRDLQSATGSATDVLRNLPSVEVDVQGGISLRGDSNVTILIDGKPSALLAGSDALEQIPAENIAQIEVITNPSAQYKPDGSGGIINIIMRKEIEAGRSGSVRANVGSEGRYNASASGAAKFGRYSLRGSLAYRRDVRIRSGEDDRIGTGTESQATSNKMRRQAAMMRLGAEAELDERNSLEATFSTFIANGRQESVEHNISRSAGGLLTQFDRYGVGPSKRRGLQSELSYTLAFPTKGEELKVEVQRGYDWDAHIVNYTNITPGAPDSFDQLINKEGEIETEASADYVLPFAGGAQFKAGYNYESEQNDYNNLGLHFDAPDPGWVTDPDFTNRFIVEQAIHAAYATYEEKFGKLDVLAGLRLEGTSITAEQRTMNVTNKRSYLNLYPSLHLTYAVADGRQLRLSYSRRINRPQDEDINPSLEYRDAFNVSSGNPDLKPESTDAIEAGFQYTTDSLDALVTAYYRRTRNGFTDVSRYISDTVLLTTTENLARRIRAGLEITTNGNLGADFSYRLTGNAYYTEINPGPLSLGRFRSGMAWSGKLSFDYKLTPADQIQFSANYNARQFTAQGYRLPEFTANAGYRHNFSPAFAGVLTVNNLFDSHKNKTVLDSGAVYDVSMRRLKGRIIFAGLVYSFGAQRQEERDEQDEGPAE